ncbi:hypothetical protein [Catenulispora pinisilvae]|uniref:hypothetical protein n=1 Tax=Catenulispora pinisilvae TaxID=2705253 RepID=UPI001E3BF51C|nr:hypothetical protein [Catenulispora pinisilvae]
MTSDDSPAPAICSAKGCRQPAAWSVVWNNPKLHTPDRRKVWLACEDHRQHLADFLDVRGFLIEVEPFGPGAASD